MTGAGGIVIPSPSRATVHNQDSLKSHDIYNLEALLHIIDSTEPFSIAGKQFHHAVPLCYLYNRVGGGRSGNEAK